MTKMRVSAIITAYNNEEFIADAIVSVLDQTCPVDEVIVVDDGSTDRTGEIVKGFKKQEVQYLYQPNQGPGAARNYGIRKSKYELIAFLDADDVWLENKNQVQVDYMAEHPEIALVSGFAWWWNVSKNTRRLAGQVPKGKTSLQRDLLVHNLLGNPSRVLVRKDALQDVGLFDPEIRWGQDWELWIRFAARYDVAVLPIPFIVYRWHPDNLSSTGQLERLESYYDVSRRAILASKPDWRRSFLLVRSWSNFSHRRAGYAIKRNLPRWQQLAYSGGALLAYPWEDGWEKLKTFIRALISNQFYLRAKRFVQSRNYS
jgi:glycosyltransferase involved in cell wall biosynthesis